MKRNSRKNPFWAAVLSLALVCASCSNSAGDSGSGGGQLTALSEVQKLYNTMLGKYTDPEDNTISLTLTDSDSTFKHDSYYYPLTEKPTVLPTELSMGLGTLAEAKEWYLSNSPLSKKEEFWNENYSKIDKSWEQNSAVFAFKEFSNSSTLIIHALKKTDTGVKLLRFIPNNNLIRIYDLIPITSGGSSGGEGSGGSGGSISFDFKRAWKLTGEDLEGKWLDIKDNGTFDMYKQNSVCDLYTERTWTVKGSKLTLHCKTSSAGVDSEVEDTFTVSGTEGSMEWNLTESRNKINGQSQTSTTSSGLLNMLFGKALATQASFTAK